MSRVGKKPVHIPDNTKIDLTGDKLVVKGAKGELCQIIHSEIDLDIKDNYIKVGISDNRKTNRALQGLTRSLIANMVTGVTKGFERVLEINGIGYRATLSGNSIIFNLGYSHPINFELPKGVKAAISKNNKITLASINKEQLGHTAAAIRRLRPPEPYKGKGIKYAGERLIKKAGKSGAK